MRRSSISCFPSSNLSHPRRRGFSVLNTSVVIRSLVRARLRRSILIDLKRRIYPLWHTIAECCSGSAPRETCSEAVVPFQLECTERHINEPGGACIVMATVIPNPAVSGYMHSGCDSKGGAK